MSPDDETSSCRNYPTSSYASYAECDTEYVRKVLPGGLIPFWTLTVDKIHLAANANWNGSKEEHKRLLDKLGLFND